MADLKERADLFLLSDLGFNDARGRTLNGAGFHD